MNEQRGRQQQQRRPPRGRKPKRATAKAKAADLWRPVPQLGELEPVVPAGDPTALLRSLGDVPLQGQGAVADHYVAAVVERAAAVATALAASADLLAASSDEP